MATAPPAASQTPPVSSRSATQSPEQRLARDIMLRFRFAKDGWRRLYAWRDGKYEEADDWLEKEVIRTLEQRGRPWLPKLADGATRYVRAMSSRLWDQPPLDRICLENGVFNTTSMALTPHDPAFLSQIQLPLTYDPAATCPSWDAFLGEVLEPAIHPLFWEMFGLMLVPDTSLQKLICFYGTGANGKSVLLSALQKAIGQENISAVSLHKLQISRFSSAGLYGKLVNIHADIPHKRLEEASEIKSLIGEDTIEGERKHRDAFVFKPFARHLFSANELPGAKDHTYAFSRRWLIVPFERTFTPDQSTPKHEIIASLCSKEALSGALNKAIEGLNRLRAQGHFTEPQSVKDAFDSFERDNNPLLRWVEDDLVIEQGASVLRSTLFEAYRSYCERADLHATTSRDAFGRELKAMLKRRYNTELGTSQLRVQGERARAYLGVRLRGPSIT